MIAVDRLVLEVPGMSPARAERLARAIAEMVAGAGTPDVERLAITLAAGASDDAAILAALAASLGAGIR